MISFSKTWLDKDRTYMLKGVCMIMIILHHIYVRVGFEPTVLGFMMRWGYVGTGIFFFLSGFGLFMSLNKKDHIPFTWLTDKLKKFLAVYTAAFVCYLALAITIDPALLNWKLLVDYITLTIPGTTTWFFKVIVVLYILTYLVFCRNISSKAKVGVLSIISILYFALAYFYLPDFWWSSVLNFPLGLIVGHQYKKLPPHPSDYYC